MNMKTCKWSADYASSSEEKSAGNTTKFGWEDVNQKICKIEEEPCIDCISALSLCLTVESAIKHDQDYTSCCVITLLIHTHFTLN